MTTSPRSPAGHIPAAPILEEELDIFLADLAQARSADTSHVLPALQALAYVWAYLEKTESGDVSASIPRWVLEDLATRYLLYKDLRIDGDSFSVGEVFGIEGGGQGNEPKVVAWEREIRDRRIALRIAFEVADGTKVDAALFDMETETGLSRAQVRRTWQKHREHAREAVRNYRQRS